MNEKTPVLGTTIRHPIESLEAFEAPPGVSEVTMTAHEFTSLCPVTGQPDFGEVEIRYSPNGRCLESKSLKLWLWNFRERGAYCEKLATVIAGQIDHDIQPNWVEVTVRQAPRGGICVQARAFLRRLETA